MLISLPGYPPRSLSNPTIKFHSNQALFCNSIIFCCLQLMTNRQNKELPIILFIFESPKQFISHSILKFMFHSEMLINQTISAKMEKLTYAYLSSLPGSYKDIMQQAVLLSQNAVMEYDWGSSDPNCLIATLTGKQAKKYAELWMGTHPRGPSKIQGGMTLQAYLGTDLPFLYKLLCVEKALSIQLHPNKQQAEHLHSAKPNIYGDPNDKPEMFLALSDFQCLMGILPLPQLNSVLSSPPFNKLSSSSSLNPKSIIAEILAIPSEQIKAMIEQLLFEASVRWPQRVDLLKRLQEQFPNDAGILVSCLMVRRVVKAGNCWAIGAGVPHAYLHGTCLQIMKNSDNVVRLGLTPKLTDVETMLSIMKDAPGTDGQKIQINEDHSFSWNGLSIRPIIIETQSIITLQVKSISIGLIASGVLKLNNQNQVQEGIGSVIMLRPGKYQLSGPISLYLGSYCL